MSISETLENLCFQKACYMIESGLIERDFDPIQLTDLLIKLENEKNEKNLEAEKNIEYNDPIISIDEIGICKTVDISVSGDNLFYCNNILTKNSFGLPATADLFFALISTEELDALNQIMVKQLKNRYSDVTKYRKFLVGINKSKMRLYDLEESAQKTLVDNPTSQEEIVERNNKSKFKNNKFDDITY